MKRQAILAVLSLLALSLTACPRGGDDHGGDDDDDVATTPAPFDVCQIVWASADATIPNVYDLFLVDAPKSQWIGGTLDYNVNSPIGVLYNEKALPSSVNPDPIPASAAITTAGSFQLTLGSGTATGGTVQFSDTPGQMFYSLNPYSGDIGGLVGTGYAMSFDGEWSDPDPDAPLTNGEGTASIVYLDSSLTLGVYGSYAVCYSSATTATAAERAALTLDRVLRQIGGAR